MYNGRKNYVDYLYIFVSFDFRIWIFYFTTNNKNLDKNMNFIANDNFDKNEIIEMDSNEFNMNDGTFKNVYATSDNVSLCMNLNGEEVVNCENEYYLSKAEYTKDSDFCLPIVDEIIRNNCLNKYSN